MPSTPLEIAGALAGLGVLAFGAVYAYDTLFPQRRPPSLASRAAIRGLEAAQARKGERSLAEEGRLRAVQGTAVAAAQARRRSESGPVLPGDSDDFSFSLGGGGGNGGYGYESFADPPPDFKYGAGVYKMPHVSTTGDLPALQAALQKAQSPAPAALKDPRVAAEEAPVGDDESRTIARAIVGRANAADPSLGIEFVDLDSVLKTVDSYKTLRYVMQINVYVRKNVMSAKLAAIVYVDTKNSMFFDVIKTYDAMTDDSGVMGSTVDHRELSSFTQAVSYP
jgi:hypothetical protein